jgi:hypothetical protein
MKKLFTLMALASICNFGNAQTTDSIPAIKKTDTIRIGNIIIVKDGSKTYNDSTHISAKHKHKKPSNISTNWLIVDVGFTNYSDLTDYANTGNYLLNRSGVAPLGKNDFGLNEGKSVNVNIWFFMQRLNLAKHLLNLKYGLGLELNNYRYKSSISYLEKNPFNSLLTPSPVVIRDSISFSKNKLAADYLTVPLMLNYTSNPNHQNKSFSLSLGVSAGYLYSQRNKQVSNERGKRINKGNYDLEQFKVSYVGEIGYGPVRFYGSYTPQSIYKTGLEMRPYSFGIRFSNW